MSSWQDIVLTLGALLFAVALLPTLKSEDKPPVSTSLMTGVTLYVFALTFSTLNLWFSAIMNLVTGSLWLTLAYQKTKQTKKPKL